MTDRYTTAIESPWDIYPDKYQLMPRLDYDKYTALKNLIAENGIEVPIMVDADMYILDGHHRRMAWLELLNRGVEIPSEVRIDVRADLATEEQKLEVVYSLNSVRRDPSDAERKKLLQTALKDFTHWGNKRIADMLGIHDSAVARQRDVMEDTGTIAHYDAKQRRDGWWQVAYFDNLGNQQTIRRPTREEADQHYHNALAKIESTRNLGLTGAQITEDSLETTTPSIADKPIREVIEEVLREHPYWPDQRISRVTGGALWLVEARRQRLEEAGEIEPGSDLPAVSLGDVPMADIERYSGIRIPEPPRTPIEEVAFKKVGELVALLKDNDLSGADVASHIADDPTFAYGLGQDYDFLIDWVREFVVALLKTGESTVADLTTRIRER